MPEAEINSGCSTAYSLPLVIRMTIGRKGCCCRICFIPSTLIGCKVLDNRKAFKSGAAEAFAAVEAFVAGAVADSDVATVGAGGSVGLEFAEDVVYV